MDKVLALITQIIIMTLPEKEEILHLNFPRTQFISWLIFNPNRKNGLTYSDAGVDIDAGNLLVNAIKPLASSTARTGCTADLGGFGGFFDLKAAGFKDPLLVSGTDGVGTKLKVFDQLLLPSPQI